MPRADVRLNAAHQPESDVHLEGNEYLKVTVPVRFDSWPDGETFVIGPWKPDVRAAGVRLPSRAESLTSFTEVNALPNGGPRALDATFSFEVPLTPELLATIERTRARAPETEILLDFPIHFQYVMWGPVPGGLRSQPASVTGMGAQKRYSRDQWLSLIAPLSDSKVWIVELAAPPDPQWKEARGHLLDARNALYTRDPLAARTVLSSCRAAWRSVRAKLGPHWQDSKELQRQFGLRSGVGHLNKQERVELIGSNLTTLWNAVRYFAEIEGHREGGFDVSWDDAVLAYRLTHVMLAYLSWNPPPFPAPSRKSQTGARSRSKK